MELGNLGLPAAALCLNTVLRAINMGQAEALARWLQAKRPDPSSGSGRSHLGPLQRQRPQVAPQGLLDIAWPCRPGRTPDVRHQRLTPKAGRQGTIRHSPALELSHSAPSAAARLGVLPGTVPSSTRPRSLYAHSADRCASASAAM